MDRVKSSAISFEHVSFHTDVLQEGTKSETHCAVPFSWTESSTNALSGASELSLLECSSG